MLPGKDGFAVAAELRAAGQFVPILMLTARGRPEDVLQGFEAGADDYLPKPFELRSCSRAQRPAAATALERAAIRRRPTTHARRRITFAGRDDRFRRDGSARAGQDVPADADGVRPAAVSGARTPGRPCPAATILEDVWDLHEDTDTRAIDNFIVRLRRYIEDRPAVAEVPADRPRRRLQVRRPEQPDVEAGLRPA